MTRKLDENAISRLERTLAERFGDPLTAVRPIIIESCTCNQCGGMMELEGDTCSECGTMEPELD